MGNIKGTFGFVDANGEIKRVSYSSANGTGFKSTTHSPLTEQVSVVQNIPRPNRTVSPSTKRPSVIYATAAESSSARSTVVQPIPRKGYNSTGSSSTTENPKKPWIRPKGRHRFVINGQQRPLIYGEDILETEEVNDEDSQITRPGAVDKAAALTKVVFTKRPLDQELRPITEIFEEKDEETKVTSGNALRRQLQDETTKTAVPVVEDDDDQPDVFGGALSTSRPLFTSTTLHSRPSHRVSTVRSEHRHRPNYLSNHDNPGPAKFTTSKSEVSTKVYENEAKGGLTEERNIRQPLFVRALVKEKDHVRQGTESILIRQPHSQPLRTRDATGRLLIPAPQHQQHHQPTAADAQAEDEQQPTYQTIPVGRVLVKSLENQGAQRYANDANIQYLAEGPIVDPDEVGRVPVPPLHPAYYLRNRLYHRQLLYPEAAPIDPRGARVRPVPVGPVPAPVHPEEISPDYGYRAGPPHHIPEPHHHPIAPPLSRRDFQILLRRLLISQYGLQVLNNPRAYLEDALLDLSYHPGYHQPLYHRVQEIPYGPEAAAPLPPPPPPPPVAPPPPYAERLPPRRPLYATRGLSPLYHALNQYDDYPDTRYAKRVYRQKLYTPETEDEDEEILPPHVREALLLRMLQLAINDKPAPAAAHQNPVMTVKTKSQTPRYRKNQVRNVQILNDDGDEEKTTRKTKP